MALVLPAGSSHIGSTNSAGIPLGLEDRSLLSTKEKVSLLFTMIVLIKALEKTQSDISSSLGTLREKTLQRLENSFEELISSLDRKSWNAVAALVSQACILKADGYIPTHTFQQIILPNKDFIVSAIKGFLDTREDAVQASSQQLKSLSETSLQSQERLSQQSSQAAEKIYNLLTQWIQVNTR